MPVKQDSTLDFQSVARILNLPAPATGNEPARLTDLQAAIAGLDFIDEPVVAIATANVNVASPGATFDGVAPTSGDSVKGRILLAGQTTASQNGTYIWNGATSPLTRTADEFQAGSVVAVGPGGSVYPNTLWLQTVTAPVIGTSSMTFTQFGQTFSNGTGITISGNVIALSTPVALANGGTGSGTASGARTNLGAAGVYSASFGDGTSTSFTINHNLGNRYCHVVVTNTSTNQDEDVEVTRNSANQLVLSSEAWTAAAPAASSYEVCCIG